MEIYNTKSCNPLEKPYYKPIEAALRWCELINHEVAILQVVGEELLPPLGAFPQWRCLRVNAEKVYEAVINGELPYGRDGRTVSAGDHVKKERLTIRHTDLKAWMAKYYPDQKPQFLFDDVERSTHSAINADAFRALQVDREALKARIENAEDWAKKIKAERSDLLRQIESLKKQAGAFDPLDPRERTTLLTIIAVLCKEARLDYTTAAKTAGLIQSTAATMGVSIGETTIEGHLKKIPDALGTRTR
jgi:hypothetical protein